MLLQIVVMLHLSIQDIQTEKLRVAIPKHVQHDNSLQEKQKIASGLDSVNQFAIT